MTDGVLLALLAMARRVLERRAAREAEATQRRATLRVVKREDAA